MLRELKVAKGSTKLDIGKVNHMGGQSFYTGTNLNLISSEPKEPRVLLRPNVLQLVPSNTETS